MALSFYSFLIISARIFFIDVPQTWFSATSQNGRFVPWSSWGPQHSRSVEVPRQIKKIRVGGSCVVWAVLVPGSSVKFQAYMADSSPSAVAGGVGKVVRGPTIFEARSARHWETGSTYLPYVEVVNNCVFDDYVHDIILDEEMMLIFSNTDVNGTVDIVIFDM
ncbi:hypothetical protein K503DRAFT_207476 [Rhizopogon vinicolor AM-OR11-026]|uniref:Uncharacterized protein n=1 Tax=Rhizopogon vinicolor AM-OR11-026 TaxID=1314800 RepID=A0A1B7MZ09_9AGAM|nr:hypothetical protein K503DRAFT_207476 [Rhizopogon vinicolor AM-OR11-026]